MEGVAKATNSRIDEFVPYARDEQLNVSPTAAARQHTLNPRFSTQACEQSPRFNLRANFEPDLAVLVNAVLM